MYKLNLLNHYNILIPRKFLHIIIILLPRLIRPIAFQFVIKSLLISIIVEENVNYLAIDKSLVSGIECAKYPGVHLLLHMNNF